MSSSINITNIVRPSRAVLLKRPRSEDMRVVAEAQMGSGPGMVIHLNARDHASRALRDATAAIKRYERTIVENFCDFDRVASAMNKIGLTLYEIKHGKPPQS
jgi:hypothetical protein